jgi:hypothetical protein
MALNKNHFMTTREYSLTLVNYESEEIFDVIKQLESSLGCSFKKDAFSTVTTFGELCDVFEQHAIYEHSDDCTTQQAFYRVRNTMAMIQNIPEKQIIPETNLAEIFPRFDRKQKVKDFTKNLGVNVKLLTFPGWFATIIAIGFLSSVIAFFFDGKVALGGLVFFILVTKIAEATGNVLTLKTVRELTEKLVREHYTDMRRTKNTMNKHEIVKLIVDSFSEELLIDKSNLTHEAKFSWAKQSPQ